MGRRSAAGLTRAGEIDEPVVSCGIADPRQSDAAPQQEGVTYDLGLLLYPVPIERPAGLEAVVVTAPRVAVQQQVPVSLHLRLPDVGHLMDEETLPQRMRRGEVVTIGLSQRVEVQVPPRRHLDLARLQWEELA